MSAGHSAGDQPLAENSIVPVPIDAVSPSSGAVRVVGLMLVSLGPALFWTAGLAFIAKIFGFTATPGMLAGTLLPMFSLLLLACSPCFLGAGQAWASARQSNSSSATQEASFASQTSLSTAAT
jgi:hypothetical protein